MGKRALLMLGSSMGLLALIFIAGRYGWIEIVISSFGRLESLSIPVLVGFGFLAGALSFFAPCAFVLFPGYVSYYLSLGDEGNREGNRFLQSISMGSICALGAIGFFMVLGVGASLVGSSVSHYLIQIKPLIALFIIILGILLLANVSMDLAEIRSRIPVHVSTGENPGPVSKSGFFLYGFGYGLATTGCTFPLFLSLIIAPITSGRFITGFFTFISFALGMGLLMVAATVLVGLSKDALMRTLTASTTWIKRTSGLVLILVGVYLAYYFIRAGM